MLESIDTYLREKPGVKPFFISLVSVALLGIIDFLTGYEFSFSIFYLIPIAVASWYGRKSHAIMISILSALTWMLVDYLAGHPYFSKWIPLWNSIVRFGFFMIIVVLLTKLHEVMKHMEILSRTDPLTRVNNPRAFKEWLSRYLLLGNRFNQPLSLGYIDLDNFKQVNDRMGHSTGDKVLLLVGSLLQSSVRATDIVGRLGGDEFAVLLPNTDRDNAVSIFEKLHKRLLREMQNNSWPVGFSIGVAIFPHPSMDVNDALRQADRLMYEIKNSSKNSIRYQVITEGP